MHSDLWVITTFFNPVGYKTKRRNFETFMTGMREAGANVLVIELAFGDQPFELDLADNIVRLRGAGVMWQRERLLNIAAAKLPDSCRKVAWIDADVLFETADWPRLTSEALNEHVVVQLFSHGIRLNRDNREDETTAPEESFASCFVRNPALSGSASFHTHGHTGYAWAARRELFEQCGVYDACLTGSNDHLMAHVFAGASMNTPCIANTIGPSQPYADHFVRWARQAARLVRRRLGVVPGTIRHLWHGDLVDRRYWILDQQFKSMGFDPDAHLRLDENGLFDWADAPPFMKSWASRLFETRNEDGKALVAEEASRVAHA